MTGFDSKRKMARDKLVVTDIDGHVVRDARKPKKAQPVQEPQDIAALVEGMDVSIDVSTGEHDAWYRLFGVVNLVQQNQSSKHGLILLVQEPKENFMLPRLPPKRPWLELTEEEMIEYLGHEYSTKKQLYFFKLGLQAAKEKNI